MLKLLKRCLLAAADAVALLPERFLTGDLRKVFDKIYNKDAFKHKALEAMRLAPTANQTPSKALLCGFDTILR
jgi:hypothetical protein